MANSLGEARGMKKTLFEVMEDSSNSYPRTSKAFTLFIMVLILLNALAIVLETVEPIYAKYWVYLDIFDLLSVFIFSLEYCARLYCCTEDPRYQHPVFGRIRFMFTPFAIIDLLAIIPFYLTFFVNDLRFLRLIRLLRIFRVIKLVRYSKALHTFGHVARDKKEELVIIAIAATILIFLTSSLMYYAEHEAQPDIFSSIPASMWWAVVTLTTVGYGDVYPVTDLGKALGAVIALFGIGMFAIPAGILGAAFMEEIEDQRDKAAICPHCGEPISTRRYPNKRE